MGDLMEVIRGEQLHGYSNRNMQDVQQAFFLFKKDDIKDVGELEHYSGK